MKDYKINDEVVITTESLGIHITPFKIYKARILYKPILGNLGYMFEFINDVEETVQSNQYKSAHLNNTGTWRVCETPSS